MSGKKKGTKILTLRLKKRALEDFRDLIPDADPTEIALRCLEIGYEVLSAARNATLDPKISN